MKDSGRHLILCTPRNGCISSIAYEPRHVWVWLDRRYSVWSASGGVSVLDFEGPSGLLVWFPLDFATTCVGICGVIYSNFRESRVNVTGPYFSASKLEWREVVHELKVTSLVKLTFIMAPNLPSVSYCNFRHLPRLTTGALYP